MAEDLTYDGQILTWRSNHGKKYKAISGLPTLPNVITREEEPAQSANYQSREFGPVPEGTYHLSVFMNGTAKPQNKYAGLCNLAPSGGGLEKIPNTPGADRAGGKCNQLPYGGWGYNRIRLFKDKMSTPTKRDNFYLHDSSKGFSHGCVETEGSFFDDLKVMMK